MSHQRETRGRVGRLAWLALTAGGVVVASSCSGSVELGREDPSDAAEREIAELLSDLGGRADVECPADVEPEKGTTFECTATVEGEEVHFGVTLTSDSDAEIASRGAITSSEQLEDLLVDRGLVPGAEAADCGSDEIIVAAVSETITCVMTVDGEQGPFDLVVYDEDGHVTAVGPEAEAVIADQLSDAEVDVDVDCPGVLGPSRRMECTAAIGDQVAHYRVEITGTEYDIERVEALLDMDKAEDFLLDRGAGEQADCGGRRLLALPVGATFTCEVTNAGTTESVTLMVTDVDGGVTITS